MKKKKDLKNQNLDDTFSITMELQRPLLHNELKNEDDNIEEETTKDRKKLVIISTILIILAVGIIAWLNDSYKPQTLAKEALVSDSLVEVNVGKNISFTPKNVKPTKGFIFYPGAKVEPEAYAPMCKEIAKEGYEVVIADMPFNLAIFSYKKAQKIINQYSDIETWVVGGHSLGGTMAAKFASENNTVDGVVLLASYPMGDELKNMSKDVISIWGSKDGVVNFENLIKSKEKLPKDTTYVEIEGANHAQFGDYGQQKGDQDPTITKEEQMDISIDNIVKFMDGIN